METTQREIDREREILFWTLAYRDYSKRANKAAEDGRFNSLKMYEQLVANCVSELKRLDVMI